MISPKAPLSRGACVVLLIVFAVAWFAGLEHRALLHPDEGRYAEIPREMVVSGDWLSPRLNGLKYFEKPPLQYWTTALAYDAFGVHNWTARLWPALSTFLAALFVGYVGRRLAGPAVGLYGIAGVLGCVGVVIDAHVLTLDAGFGAFLTVAFGAFVLAQHDATSARDRRAWMWVTWSAMAAATLSKGLIGIVIPGASLVLYTLVTRDFALWRRLHLLSGSLIYLVLAAPWFIFVSQANPEFFQFFFVHEHFDRYLTAAHKRQHGWWYFVPLLIVGTIPWLPLLAWGAPRMWRDGRPGANGFSWQRFGIVWSIFIFVFFSASQSKLPSYILPMFPVLVLLAAWLLDRAPTRALARLTLAAAAVVVAVLIVMIVAYEPLVRRFVKDAASVGPTLAFAPWARALFAVAALGSAAAYLFLRRATIAGRSNAVLALAFSTLAASQLSLIGFDEFRTLRSSGNIIAAAEAVGGSFAPDAPFFNVKMFDQTVPLLLHRTTTFVEYRDEFALGEDAEPEKAFATESAWIPVWESLDRGYAMMPADEFERLSTVGLPMRLLARNTTSVIVSRR